MTLAQALSLFSQAVVLSVGLQFIGWAKWRARLAEEGWRRRGGPEDQKALEDLRRAIRETNENVERAGRGLASAAAQMRRGAE